MAIKTASDDRELKIFFHEQDDELALLVFSFANTIQDSPYSLIMGYLTVSFAESKPQNATAAAVQ